MVFEVWYNPLTSIYFTSSTALAYTGDGTYTANPETWPNGTVSASLAVSDLAGNSFGATATAALHVATTVSGGAAGAG